MGKKKASMKFTPNPDNAEQIMLHRYLTSLDVPMSRLIWEAVKDKFLPIAMFKAGIVERLDFQVASIHSIAKLNAQIEIIKSLL